MTTTLVLPDEYAATLANLTRLDVETGAVLLARPVHTSDGDLRLLAIDLQLVPEESYDIRRPDELVISSSGFVPPLREAEETAAVPIWLHTHPGDGSSPRPSTLDRRVDAALSDLFRLRAGSAYYGAVIVSHSAGALRFTGHLDTGDHKLPIERLMAVGSRFSLAWNDELPARAVHSLFDRNIRAFGGDVQAVLHDLRIAVVGCGGTGSCVAEQLVRLGVRHLLLVDPDTLSDSNVTRVYGSRPADVGRAKAGILAMDLLQIAPDAQIRPVQSTITVEATARELAGMDVVFGCTDDNAGRLVLSRLATYALVPVIDCGVLLTSDSAGRLDGIHGRITVLHPGAACLVCRNRIDLPRASSEMLSAEERVRRADEGYAPALPGIEPAVVSYTTMVAAAAVNELLERLTHYGPDPVPSEVLLRIHDREISTNEQAPTARHYCHPDSGKLGLGVTQPFLEQLWQA